MTERPSKESKRLQYQSIVSMFQRKQTERDGAEGYALLRNSTLILRD